ncbi:MAG: hypothetical protein HC882_03105 [Acidobacteria bacterium]|nr:hypothetical protein [Acidobacteriota bacterium]
MTDLMLRLRRSSRTLLARDGHPGPGPGRVALVMSRAGVGKTAFLVGIGIDSLLAGQRVLHVSRDRTVDKVRDRYDEIFHELIRPERGLDNIPRIQLEMERRRHIYSFFGDAFSVARLNEVVHMLAEHVDFRPDVLIIDRMDIRELSHEEIAGVRALAEATRAEAWMSCRTHRDDPPAAPGHLPPPADSMEDILDLVFRLDPKGDQVRLHVLKDRDQMLDRDTHVGLDPSTLLLVPMHPSSLG